MLDNYIGTESFISQKPSIEFIEAPDDTELLIIKHSDFYRLNKAAAQDPGGNELIGINYTIVYFVL